MMEKDFVRTLNSWIFNHILTTLVIIISQTKPQEDQFVVVILTMKNKFDSILDMYLFIEVSH